MSEPEKKPDAPEEPKALTTEDVGKIVANALAGFTRKQLPKLVSQAISDVQKAAKPEQGDDEPETPETAKPQGDSPELRKLQKRLEKVEKENAEIRTAMEKAEQNLERSERHGFLKTELSKHKVIKPELAFKVLRDDILRGANGELYAKDEKGDKVGAAEYIATWVKANPELLPPHGAGESRSPGGGAPRPEGTVSLDDIRPGATKETLEKAGKQILQALRPQ